MPTHVVPNTTAAEPTPRPPDGSDYVYEMTFDGGKLRAWAHTSDELLDLLIDGYSALDGPEAKLSVRIDLAATVIAGLQATLLADAGDPLPADLLDQVSDPLAAVDVAAWDHPAPLVIIDVAYQPYTPRPRPIAGAGRVLTFETYEEEGFLRSLASAGHISLGVRAVQAPGLPVQPPR